MEVRITNIMEAVGNRLVETQPGGRFMALGPIAGRRHVECFFFSAVITVKEEWENDGAVDNDLPWRFFQVLPESLHNRLTSVLQKNALRKFGASDGIWFKSLEQAAILAFFAQGGKQGTFELVQHRFRHQPSSSWPVDLFVSPLGVTCWQQGGIQISISFVLHLLWDSLSRPGVLDFANTEAAAGAAAEGESNIVHYGDCQDRLCGDVRSPSYELAPRLLEAKPG